MVFTFCLNEYVVPVTSFKARQLEKGLRGADERAFDKRNNLFEKGEDNRFYVMQGYLTRMKLMLFPTVIDLYADGSGVERRIDADRGAPVADSSRGPGYWEFTNAEQRTFNRDGSLKSFDRFKSLQVQMESDLDVFLAKSKEPEEMNFNQLMAHINIIANKSDKSVVAALKMSLHKKIAFPVATLLMVLLGFAVVVDVHARHFTQAWRSAWWSRSPITSSTRSSQLRQQQWMSPFWPLGVRAHLRAIDYLLYLRLSKIRL